MVSTNIKSPVFLKRINWLIDSNIAETDYSIENMAAELGISRIHLYRTIKYFTGNSPNQYIRDRKLTNAYYLLYSTRKSITEIAFEVGFNNLSYFARSFKNKFNINPSSLKKSLHPK